MQAETMPLAGSHLTPTARVVVPKATLGHGLVAAIALQRPLLARGAPENVTTDHRCRRASMSCNCSAP